MQTVHFAAVDLGAESGRVLDVAFDGRAFRPGDAFRFPNEPVRLSGTLYWDILCLYKSILQGLSAGAKASPPVAIGVDTWGVDFGLLAADGSLLCNPVHYRDARTQGEMERVWRQVPQAEIFDATGIQSIPFNTLYQLTALKSSQPWLLEQAARILTIPDLLNYWLTGQQACELTIASTTQMLDVKSRTWAIPLLQRLGLPTHILPGIIPAGTVLGPVNRRVAAENGLPVIPVVAPACHDTGSAVAATPLTSRNSVYISSGTWSLVGLELDAPCMSPDALAWNFTNECGADGTIRCLQNVMGLWLLQECRRTWLLEGKEFSYPQLEAMAEASAPFASFINPSHLDFLAPGSMPQRIEAFCSHTHQPAPHTPDEITRCIFESLALQYRFTIEQLKKMTGISPDVVHIVGGGSKNKLLCQMTANACGCPVMAGPSEATALGNALMQARALGHIGSLAEGRAAIRASFSPIVYQPQEKQAWQDATGRFQKLLA